jgi:hypothetical protein
MDTSWLGFWICMDDNHDLLLIIYDFGLEKNIKPKKVCSSLRHSMDIKRRLESKFLLFA